MRETEASTEMPRDAITAYLGVDRSLTGRGRASVLAGWARRIAAANRSLAASDRRSDWCRSRPAQPATAIATAVTTTVGASHNRISTWTRLGRRGWVGGLPRRGGQLSQNSQGI